MKILILLAKYLSYTRLILARRRAWWTKALKASTQTRSLPDGHVITQRSADASYIIVSEIGQLRSDIVTWSLCFIVDLHVATFIFPSALNIDGGYAANLKADTSLKLISREHASRPMTRA